jgi:hypothetical protein
MRFTTIDQYLIQLTQWGAVNCYLVREKDGFTLVDTCYRGVDRLILEFAAKASSKSPSSCALRGPPAEKITEAKSYLRGQSDSSSSRVITSRWDQGLARLNAKAS